MRRGRADRHCRGDSYRSRRCNGLPLDRRRASHGVARASHSLSGRPRLAQQIRVREAGNARLRLSSASISRLSRVDGLDAVTAVLGTRSKVRQVSFVIGRGWRARATAGPEPAVQDRGPAALDALLDRALVVDNLAAALVRRAWLHPGESIISVTASGSASSGCA